ncbi:MAG: efflux RND transporter periplasmic adaptor subunit [Myxococcota bacterium]
MLNRSVYLLLLAAGCGDPTIESEPPPRPIAWSEAVPANSVTTRRLSGVVQAIESAPLSFEVGGRVASVEVDLGERFSANQPLARLDRRTFRLEAARRRAELVQAEATRVEANAQLRRAEAMFATQAISAADYDRARASADVAIGRVDLGQASVDLARKNLSDTILRAPFDGVVTIRQVEPSQRVQPGQMVFEVQSVEAGLEVLLQVPETLIGGFEVGSVHSVAIPALPGGDHPARVREIGAAAQTSNAFPVTLALEGDLAGVRPGMTAEAQLSFASGGTDDRWVAVPVDAILPWEGQGHVAYVYDRETETVRRRPVELATTRGDQAFVATGLAVGDVVASRGTAFLADDQPVTLLAVGYARYNP